MGETRAPRSRVAVASGTPAGERGATPDEPRPLPLDTVPAAFRAAVAEFGSGPALVLGHNDADGLSAALLLAAGLERAGRPAEIRILGRGETPWSDEIRREIDSRQPGALLVTDLGIRAPAIRPGLPTVLVDHHVPRGRPKGATVLTGYGLEPQPTSSLLAFHAASGIADVDDLVWLAALGLIGDMAEAGGFSELATARARYGITALRKATSLVNQARRSASGNPAPALALLRKADGPKAVLSGEHPETATLLAARDEVRVALEAARKTPPKLTGEVALIAFASPCQVHPLVAQTWAGRLRGRIVLAANTGFRPGWVHFAARSDGETDLIAFLARHAPEGAEENYGGGHARASGGVLRPADWNSFVRGLGFGPEAEVAA